MTVITFEPRAKELIDLELERIEKMAGLINSKELMSIALNNTGVLYQLDDELTDHIVQMKTQNWKWLCRNVLNLLPKMENWKFDLLPIAIGPVWSYGIVIIPNHEYAGHAWKEGKGKWLKENFNVSETFVDWYVRTNTCSVIRPLNNYFFVAKLVYELFENKEGENYIGDENVFKFNPDCLYEADRVGHFQHSLENVRLVANAYKESLFAEV